MENDNSVKRIDQNGILRSIVNFPETTDLLKSSQSATEVAMEYIKKTLGLKNFGDKGSTETVLVAEPEKKTQDTIVVSFRQMSDGLTLDLNGITVVLSAKDLTVYGLTNNYDYDFEKLRLSEKELQKEADAITEADIAKMIDLELNKKRAALAAKEFNIKGDVKLEITARTCVLYRYDAEHRQHNHGKNDWKDRDLVNRLLHLELPKVSEKIKDGKYYGAVAVHFTGSIGKLQLAWKAIIEPRSATVLHIHPLVELQTGYVYLQDPVTESGGNAIVPSSPAAVLNTVRDPKNFSVVPALGNALVGDFIRIADTMPPAVAPPTTGNGRWDYNANSDDFSAVNAYYHCDMVFRLVQDMGFNMNTYFDGTSFPVNVDHRGCCGCVNAAAWSNGAGLNMFTFGLVQAGQPVGIATDLRIVFHEFGHAILFDHVNSGSYGFAHSCGDSMAAIYSDPCSNAPDRFETFPWLTLSNPTILRRHDRQVSNGWAWQGVNDDQNYGSEQILATTLFRAYRSLGGDHSELCERQFASRYMLYLNFYAVGLLTPISNPSTAEDYAGILTIADINSVVFEGQPGGLVHKVVRWAFAKQGAFYSGPLPNLSEGPPPAIDTFINDGRNGEYEFTEDWCQTKTIWNRHKDDDAGEHQPPVAGTTNYIYVVVENRGTQTTGNGKVSLFHLNDKVEPCCCGNCGDLKWKDDFKPAVTQTLGHGPIQSNSYEIIGPFKWIPKEDDCALITVDSKGDRSNVHHINPGLSVPLKHLVPFDNNIAIRCMCEK